MSKNPSISIDGFASLTALIELCISDIQNGRRPKSETIEAFSRAALKHAQAYETSLAPENKDAATVLRQCCEEIERLQ